MFRILQFWIRSLFNKDRIRADELSVSYFRVMPWDCDPNFHMTNARYFSYMDYGRFWRYFHARIFKSIFVTNRWMPMATAQEITYIKDIAPFEKFSVHTRLAGWDDKYVYMAQDFYGKKGLCAKAMMRGVFVHKKKLIDIEKVLQVFGNPSQDASYNERIETWKKVLELKKNEN